MVNKKRYYYDYGLPFNTTLAHNLDDMKERVENNKASLIIIDGPLGSGKTTLGVHAADYISGAYAKKRKNYVKKPENFIKMDEQLALGGEDFIKKLKTCYEKDLLVLIYDESGDFTSRGALTKFNKRLNRVFDVYRAFKIVVILILPCISALDNSIFDKGIVRGLLHCHSRTKKYGSYGAYPAAGIGYLKYWMSRYNHHKSKAYKIQHPTFRGHFLDLPKKRREELDEISTKNKFEVLVGVNMEIKGLYTYLELAKRVGRSISWVKQVTSAAGIEHTRKYKKKKYFDEEALSEVQEYLDKLERKEISYKDYNSGEDND